MSTLQEVLGSWRRARWLNKFLVLTAKRREEEENACGPKVQDEIEVAYRDRRRRSCVVGEADDEEDDWEMDPDPPKQPKKRSLQSFRQSLSSKFMKKTILV